MQKKVRQTSTPSATTSKKVSHKPSDLFKVWVDEQLATSRPGARLPTADFCATQWKLSRSTVTRILEEYQDRGLIVRIPRRGTFIPDPNPLTPAPEPLTNSSTQTVADHILKSISEGNLRRGDALPSIKFMSSQFKVATRTVISAYRQLSAKSHIVKIGKSFWVGTFSQLTKLRQGQSVYVLLCANATCSDIFSSPLLGLAYSRMVQELTDYGYQIHYKPFDEHSRLCDVWRREGRWPEGIVVFGFIDAYGESLRELARYLLTARNRQKTRVLIDLHYGDYRQLPAGCSVLHRGNIDTTIARETAAYIKRKKMSPVTFIHDASSENATGLFLLVKTAVALKGFDSSFHPTIFAFNTPGNSIDTIVSRIRATAPESRLDSILHKEHELSLAEIFSSIRLVGPTRSLPDDFKTGLSLCDSDRLIPALLEHKEHPRWQGGYDFAIISLENTVLSLEKSITACCLDWNSTGYRMAHVLIKDFAIPLTTKGFMRTQAQVIERGSA